MPDITYGASLKTIDDQGNIPACRLGTADEVQNFVRRLWYNDSERARKRALVRGLVDGNPPYKQAKLREANRSDACNVNWGTGRTYLESGAGAFYDLFSEAPGCVNIQTAFGPDDKRIEWSRIMSREADRILEKDKSWDFNIQQSGTDMVLMGRGPLFFEDCFKVLPRSILDGNLKVPEMTPADPELWEVASIDIDYYPAKLYEFIQDEEAATRAGWNVEYVKQVIANATNMRDPKGRPYDWEWYQMRLKNNTLEFINDSKICKLAFVFSKEFDGKVTQVIVERFTGSTPGPIQFLFKHVGWYDGFSQCIHPFYFDRGNGGYHHSITGLGVKMYAAMEYQNRLMCNLMDKAFAPKTLLSPASSESKEKLQIAKFSDYAVLPFGVQVQQAPIQGFLSDGLAMHNASSQLMQSNLSSYRQQVAPKNGNPVTAREAMLQASQQASLSKTSYSRYYKQLDLLYAEIVRRLCLFNSTDERAKEFQDRCKAQGVPKECFGRIEAVTAQRVVGQGNPYLRADAIGSLASIVGGLPEEGRNNWTNDLIATTCGQAAVVRYNPSRDRNVITDQMAEAMQWVGLMKVGVPPVVTSSQDAPTYATVFLKAAGQALESLNQGADPQQVLAFLEICGPAIMAHLQRFANAPLLKSLHDSLLEQWKQLTQVYDKLQQQIQKMVQQKAQQAQRTQAELSDQQLKALKVASDLKWKDAKASQALRLKEQAAQQTNQTAAQARALADAKVASEISNAAQRHQHDMVLAESQQAHDQQMDRQSAKSKSGSDE